MFHKEHKYTARLLCGAAAGALVMFANIAHAEDLPSIEIASQPLAKALGEFASQTKRAVLVTPELTASRFSHSVSGATDPDTALVALLDGTGLTYRRDGDTFLIVRASDPQSGSAAGDGADQGTVQALIVTAQKREENIQDVPIAMSAFTQEDLTKSQVAGGPDLMTQVPNMTFTKTNFSSYSIQIRGIGTQAVSATTDPAVAVAFNNTPFVRNRFFEQEFYDLQRVEVLRGPQGTLYGRNATAGVVNIISAKPSFRYEAKLVADVANYNSTRLEGMINLPLVEDKVALRLAGAWTKRDGYVQNQITGQPIDGRDLWSTRVSLRVTPNDRLDANLIWEHFNESDDRLRSGKQLCKRDDRTEFAGHPLQQTNNGAGEVLSFNQGCLPTSMYSPEAFEVPNGNSLPYFHPLHYFGLPIHEFGDPYLSTTQSSDLRVIESTIEPKYWAKSDVVELQFNYDLTDNLTLSSETGYNYDELFSLQDFNRFNTAPGPFIQPEDLSPDARTGLTQHGPIGGIFCDPQLGCADRLMGADLSTARSRQFSQEFRVASNFDGPFNFSLGGNFLRYDTEDKYYVFINTLTAVAANSGQFGTSPWQPGVTDNHQCLGREAPPDPFTAYNFFPFNALCIYVDPNPIGSLNDEGHNYFLSRNPYKLISYAMFGEAYYNITDNLKITAGLRWTVDKKEAPRIPSALLVPRTRGLTVLEVVKQEWREPTGRLAIDWKPDLSFTDQTLLYASYAHGYKAGGMNPPTPNVIFWGVDGDPAPGAALVNSALKPRTFDAEFVDAFELGAKNTLADGKLTLNLAAFYYDYKNYQISQIIDRSAVNSNYDATVWGLEVETDWRPLENLRFGLKLGYENTRVADGEEGIDIMERNYGHGSDSADPWVVARPFPTFTQNCVLPLYVVDAGAGNPLKFPFGNDGSGFMGSCETAYLLGLDPVTNLQYVPDPTVSAYPGSTRPGYPGFNPASAPNNGEGFAKPLGGNELPNAPHYTATLSTDYTLPLGSDWLMTLHSDLYYQSEAWTRIFNMPGYDKLKAYSNINVAAIFSNEEAGWKVMAYVKNALDRDSITGAFLFPDDVGLTTNVFLNEPRLYGLRVTKNWNGGPWWTGANPDHPAGEPYPLTVELSGDLMRNDAPHDPIITPSIVPEGDEVVGRLPFPDAINPAFAQNRDLDIGEGGEAKVTWRPSQSAWSVSLGVRFGKAKGLDKFDGRALGDYGTAYSGDSYNWTRSVITNKEDHTLVDFEVGHDAGIGWGLDSRIAAGLRYADFGSSTRLAMNGVTDWDAGVGYYGYFTTHHFYDTDVTAKREFKGAGPTLSWDAAKTLLGDKQSGHLDVDWSVTGGVLFGKQKAAFLGEEVATQYYGKYQGPGTGTGTQIGPSVATSGPASRSKSVTVPMASASLGLSYEVQRFKIRTGYRWERYFNVLDAGYDKRNQVDRTLDGPYFKIAVGFGG
jgi:outer membrane receptor protein involved in Fe transport